MQDVLNKIPIFRWALFPWQITSRPTLLPCVTTPRPTLHSSCTSSTHL